MDSTAGGSEAGVDAVAGDEALISSKTGAVEEAAAAVAVDARRESRRRAAACTERSRPVRTRQVIYAWKASSERKRGDEES